MTLMKYAEIFGVAWLGHGVTTKHMPLLNLLALCRKEPQVLISIFDYSDHMLEGGKGMLSLLGSYSRAKFLSLFQLLQAPTHSFLMGQEPSKS